MKDSLGVLFLWKRIVLFYTFRFKVLRKELKKKGNEICYLVSLENIVEMKTHKKKKKCELDYCISKFYGFRKKIKIRE